MLSGKRRVVCAHPRERERKRRTKRAAPVDRQFQQAPRTRRLNFLDDFPGELRNKIYELALVADKPINMLSFACKDCFQRPPQTLSLSPALLATNQQIFREAKDYLYGMNTFAVTIRTRPSILRRYGQIQDADAGPEPEPDVICLSDRPRFDILKEQYQIDNLRIELDIPAEFQGGETEKCHEHLLQDMCATYLQSTKNLTISTRELEDGLNDDDIRDWHEVLEEDFDRSSDVLDMALALEKPFSVVVESSIYVQDSVE